MAKKSITPMNASFDQLCKLPRDHKDWGRWTLMTDSCSVWLSEQTMGEDRKQHFEIPRHIFNRLIKWYVGLED